MRGFPRSRLRLAALGLALTVWGSAALTAAADRPAIAPPPLDDLIEEDPRWVSPEMVEWARSVVGPPVDDRAVLTRLLQALEYERDLVYENGYTGTAREVYENGRFNCLSFTHLYVALARSLGIDAYYLSVDRDDSFSRKGDLVLVSEHVTAAFGSPPLRLVLEFSIGPGFDYHRGEAISDATALALHFSNRGAELLLEDRTAPATRAFEQAVRLSPGLASVWVNLGVARRRHGDLEGAEAAYRHGAELDPDHFPAYHNLYGLFRTQGREDAADEIIALLDRRSNRNPFTYLTLGDSSLMSDRFEEAWRFYRRALNLGRREVEPKAALGMLELQRGRVAQAQRWLRRARRVDPENPRVVELEQRLAVLSEPAHP